MSQNTRTKAYILKLKTARARYNRRNIFLLTEVFVSKTVCLIIYAMQHQCKKKLKKNRFISEQMVYDFKITLEFEVFLLDKEAIESNYEYGFSCTHPSTTTTYRDLYHHTRYLYG